MHRRPSWQPALLAAALGLFLASRLLGCGGSGSAGGDHDGGAAGDGSLAGDAGFLGDAALSADVFGGGPGLRLVLAARGVVPPGCRLLQQRLRERQCSYPGVHLRQHRVHHERSVLQPGLQQRQVQAAEHFVLHARQRVRLERSVLLGALHLGHVPAVVVLRAARRRLRDRHRLLHRGLQRPSGQTLGTCAARRHRRQLQLTDGKLCGGSTADGGIVFTDGGIPTCGGACCSRSCAPWGATGVLICQPASGCHLVGDLCTSDDECCGSAAFPSGRRDCQSQGGARRAAAGARWASAGIRSGASPMAPCAGSRRRRASRRATAAAATATRTPASRTTWASRGARALRASTQAAHAPRAPTAATATPACPDPGDAGAPFTCYPYRASRPAAPAPTTPTAAPVTTA